MRGPAGSAGVKRGTARAGWSRAVLSTYGDVCNVCGHGGARQSDHLIAATKRPDFERIASNW